MVSPFLSIPAGGIQLSKAAPLERFEPSARIFEKGEAQ
jgi:hypothetical protein